MTTTDNTPQFPSESEEHEVERRRVALVSQYEKTMNLLTEYLAYVRTMGGKFGYNENIGERLIGDLESDIYGQLKRLQTLRDDADDLSCVDNNDDHA